MQSIAQTIYCAKQQLEMSGQPVEIINQLMT